jgi:transcriptional regulator with GAF, ATPase, and Fis domain
VASTSQTSRTETAAEALLRLGQLSLRELSMESLLQTVAEMVATVLPGNIEASVTLLVEDAPTTVASTAGLALDLDHVQYEQGQGPCLNAARVGEVTEIVDTRTDSRWPPYARRAAERGNLSSLSIPLLIDEDERVCGALNLYAPEPGAFAEDTRTVAMTFGPYAAVAAGNVRAYQSARKRADNLEAAMESRASIEQAKGVLIERYKVTPDHAFRLLALASMNANRKLRDVASDLVRTGELPVVTSRGRRARPGGGPLRSRREPGSPEHC